MSQLSLYLDIPVPIFKARVNAPGTITYPLTSIPFDTVTLGSYDLIQADMTLILGTSDGADDLGRVRVQNLASSTAIPVGRVSEGYEDGQLSLEDNAFIEIWDDYRVWAKPPYIDPDTGTQYKDADITVGTYTAAHIPPVANCGPGTGATIDPDTEVITVFFTGVNSIPIADGATIVSYAWDLKDGTPIAGAIDEMEVTATFPAGKRWVALTVVDSNGLPHTARCMVVAIDPANDVRIKVFNANLSESYAGRTWDIEIKQNIPQSTYPDGCKVMIWQGEPISSSDRSHMRLDGWHQSDDASSRSSRTGNIRSTTLHVVDVAGRLATLPGFSQEVDKAETPGNWSEMTAPTVFKYLHYLLLWHSTALSLADYLPDGKGSDYPFVTFSSDGASLFDQVNGLAKKILPDHLLTCNLQGQLRIWPDPMLQDTPDRTSTIQGSLIESLMQEVSFSYMRPPKVHWLNGYAFLTQTDYTDVNGVQTLLTVQCKAPGTAPGQGVEEQETTQGIAKNQAALNNVTGHRFARMNARFGPVTVTLTDDSESRLEAARLEWVELTLSPQNAAQRGLAFATVRTLIKSINRRYEARRTATRQSATYQLEIETVGKPALTVIPDGQDFNTDPIPATPGIGLITGQDTIAAIGKFKVYRTADFTTDSGSGGPTWDAKDLTGADEMLSFVVDPFSPGYIEGAGTIDGWAASTTKLYRLEDLHGSTPLATTIITFDHTALWRTIQASFGTYFLEGQNPWLICVSYYGSASGHTGTWATYSVDGGQTWSDEVQISAFYDSGGAVNPIGLYCSPKTPGLAYTVAHLATANPATAGAFVSTDWGETWTAIVSGDVPTSPLPLFGEFTDTVATSTVTQTYNEIGLTPSATHAMNKSGTTNEDWVDVLGISPPANIKSITVQGTFTGYRNGGGFGNSGYDFTIAHTGTHVFRTIVSDSNNGLSGKNQTYIRNFVYRYDFTDYATQDWPKNRDLVEANPSPVSTDYAIRYTTSVVAGGVTSGWTADVSLAVVITEMVLDDGTVYVPSVGGIIVPLNGMAGEIHLPWQNNDVEDVIYSGQLNRSSNRQFALMRSVAGTTTDISPNDGAKDYGVNAGHFAVRCHDSDRTLVLAAVTGNDASSSSSGDKQGIYFSDDAGDTWDEVVAPTTGTEVYQAAFGGALDGTVYIWGPASYFGFSDDNGSTVDSRAGNLSSLSATKVIGICGGPTG